jgi:hypothetical protein
LRGSGYAESFLTVEQGTARYVWQMLKMAWLFSAFTTNLKFSKVLRFQPVDATL